MLPCFHHDLYRTLCPRDAFFLLQFFLFFSFFDFVSPYLEKISFPLSSNEQISSAPLFWLAPDDPVETPYPLSYFSIGIRYGNKHRVISVPYPNTNVSQRMRRFHTPSRASCLPLPANLPFLVLIGSPILLPLVLLLSPRRADLLVLPTKRKEGQISLLLLQFSWHYWSAAVLVILPTLVICIQLPPTLMFV
jgi:hypothetical protein